MRVDISKSGSAFSYRHKAARLLWGGVWLLLYRPSPRCFHAWRRLLLRVFGARIGRGVYVYPLCSIWAPWNLVMEDHSRMGDYVRCYSVERIIIGSHAMVSQYAYLCSASHDFSLSHMPLTTAPIHICDQAWVCAEAFIGPGVTVGQGAVVGARAVVFKDVQPWTVVGGNPAQFIKPRVMKSE